jgi:solute carrier family 5 (sodium-coupled monocarboxylate transporter), member 8/12
MESLNETFSSNSFVEVIHFSVVNYVVFGCMLALSALIGIYFGWFSNKKQDTTVEYLLGGKKMNFFPIASSLIASHISGATFLAVPAEVYAFGSEYALSVISAILVSYTF